MSGMARKISARLKNQSEIEKERSARRSRFRTESGLRQFAGPSRKTAQNESQIHGSLILRPNAPSYPRAIFHATCGPVQASVTRTEESSTRARTIWPASPGAQTFTV